jgi:hypothetical protein
VEEKGPNFFRLKKKKKKSPDFYNRFQQGSQNMKGFKEIIYHHISTSLNLAKSCCRRSPFWLNHKIEKKEKEKPWTLCREIAPVPYTNTGPVGRTEYLDPDKSLPKTGLRRNPKNV